METIFRRGKRWIDASSVCRMLGIDSIAQLLQLVCRSERMAQVEDEWHTRWFVSLPEVARIIRDMEGVDEE